MTCEPNFPRFPTDSSRQTKENRHARTASNFSVRRNSSEKEIHDDQTSIIFERNHRPRDTTGMPPSGPGSERITSHRRHAMSSKQERFRIAVLDDYQHVALSLADWSVLDGRATVTVFNDHLADSDAVVERLQPFDIVCVMRERTPMTRTIIERLPKLRMIASTGTRNASIDLKAAEERSVQVVHTGYTSAPTIELTWALILGSARNLVAESASLRSGGWQQTVGDDMAGRTLGVLGLGNVGGAVARIGAAFSMKVIAWSQNLTNERAAEVGAALVSKDELFQEADVVSIHLVLSSRTRGLVSAAELALMKPTARLINTSRGPIVVEADLVAALTDKKIAGAAIDVFDQEPLPPDHPLRALPNLLATPHIGYVSRGLYERFYQDTVANIRNWLDSLAEGSRAPRVAR